MENLRSLLKPFIKTKRDTIWYFRVCEEYVSFCNFGGGFSQCRKNVRAMKSTVIDSLKAVMSPFVARPMPFIRMIIVLSAQEPIMF